MAFSRARSPLRFCALKEGLLGYGHTRCFLFPGRRLYGSNYLLEGLSLGPCSAEDLPWLQRSHVRRDIPVGGNFAGSRFKWSDGRGLVSTRALGAPEGYDPDSFTRALTETKRGWHLNLTCDRPAGADQDEPESLVNGTAEGILSGWLPDSRRGNAGHSLGTGHARGDFTFWRTAP